MAENLGKMTAEATLEAKGFTAGTKQVQDDARRATSGVTTEFRRMDQAIKSSTSSFQTFGSALGKLGLGALGPLAMVTAGVSAVGRAASEALSTRADQQIRDALQQDGRWATFAGRAHNGIPIFEQLRDAATLEDRLAAEASIARTERIEALNRPIRELARDIDAGTASLRDQAATWGMTSEAAQRFRFIQRGATDEMLREYDAAVAVNREMTQMASVGRLREETVAPLERLRGQLEEIRDAGRAAARPLDLRNPLAWITGANFAGLLNQGREVLGFGGLDATQQGRLVLNRLQSSLGGLLDRRAPTLGSLERGGSEAFQAISQRATADMLERIRQALELRNEMQRSADELAERVGNAFINGEITVNIGDN